MRHAQKNIRIYALAAYLLALNLCYLHHSFDHHRDDAVLLTDVLEEGLQLSSEDDGMLCKLCDFFQNQDLFFSENNEFWFDIQPDGSIASAYQFTFHSSFFEKPQRGPPALG